MKPVLQHIWMADHITYANYILERCSRMSWMSSWPPARHSIMSGREELCQRGKGKARNYFVVETEDNYMHLITFILIRDHCWSSSLLCFLAAAISASFSSGFLRVWFHLRDWVRRDFLRQDWLPFTWPGIYLDSRWLLYSYSLLVCCKSLKVKTD